MDTLYERINVLVESSSPSDNLGAVHAIDELIDVPLGESAAKASRFASFLRRIFEEKTDADTISAAAATLGHVARAGGAMAADVVEFQVKEALRWLEGERVEARRYAAVLILKEMAANAPTVFNVHVPTFIDVIWAALRDPKFAVRERAVEALRACLRVIEKRETRWRVQGYYRLFEETEKGLQRSASVESIHGSLLAIGEMLRNTGEFMMARYKEVANIVLKYRDHRERLIRRSITALLPRIAHFLRDRFVSSYLKICMDHLLGVMKNPADRDAGFAALGEMASAVGPALRPYLPAISALLREALTPRRGRASVEALTCVGQLVAAVGDDMREVARELLPVCLHTGLSLPLVHTLAHISAHLPALKPLVQSQLIEAITAVLARKSSARIGTSAGGAFGSLTGARPPAGAGGGGSGSGGSLTLGGSASLSSLASGALTGGGGGGAGSSAGSSAGGGSVAGELSMAGVTQLALCTLYSFDLSGHDLLELTRVHVARYLEDDDVATRREAAVCCAQVLAHTASALSAPPSPSPAPSPAPQSEPSDAGAAPGAAGGGGGGGRAAGAVSGGVGGGSGRGSSSAAALKVQRIAQQLLLQPGMRKKRRGIVEDMLERLLVSSVADVDASVRKAVLACLSAPASTALDSFLAQPDCLRALFIALNDETYDVREQAVLLAGRLATRNPAYVLPALRRHLVRLLGDVEHSGDSRLREDGARLLRCLIHSCTPLVAPYIAPILKVFVARLKAVSAAHAAAVGTVGGGGTSGVVASMLATVGELAKVAGSALTPYVSDLMPLIVDSLHDTTGPGPGERREVAVVTLGQLAWSMRRSVLQVLGILGALDPHVNKRNQLLLLPQAMAAQGGVDGRGDGGVGGGAGGGGGGVAGGGGGGGGTGAGGAAGGGGAGGGAGRGGAAGGGAGGAAGAAGGAVGPLQPPRVLQGFDRMGGMGGDDPLTDVPSAGGLTDETMGLACVPFLPRVLPELFHVMRACDESLREFLFWQLAQLVGIVRQHMRKYLPEITALIRDFWHPLLLSVFPRPPAPSPVLNLVEQLARALPEDFKSCLPDMLPRCVALVADAERSGDYKRVPPVLHAFEVLGGSMLGGDMEPHMHLLLPAVVRLFKPGVSDVPLPIQRAAVRTLTRLLPALHVADHAAAILHPLARVLDGPSEELRRDAADAICDLALAQVRAAC
ncbi:unnamed protein product [Closterium sp. NIES-53]